MTDCVLNINKPEDFTSHDVVAVLRGILKTRRIGHCGTLDPMATGVLPVCVGRATKASEFIMGYDKEYLATFRLGEVSDTYDITGNVQKTDAQLPKKAEVFEAIRSFVGDIKQLAPMYSAIKVNGQKLYALARKGVEVQRVPREVVIRSIDVVEFDEARGEYTIKVVCSKGTYIRSLCHDIGEALGCGAVMSKLVRTRTGNFTIDDALSFDDVKCGNPQRGVYTLSQIFDYLPRITLSGKDAGRVKNGIRLDARAFDAKDGVTYAVYDEFGTFLCVSKADFGLLVMIRSFW